MDNIIFVNFFSIKCNKKNVTHVKQTMTSMNYFDIEKLIFLNESMYHGKENACHYKID